MIPNTVPEYTIFSGNFTRYPYLNIRYFWVSYLITWYTYTINRFFRYSGMNIELFSLFCDNFWIFLIYWIMNTSKINIKFYKVLYTNRFVSMSWVAWYMNYFPKDFLSKFMELMVIRICKDPPLLKIWNFLKIFKTKSYYIP